MVKRRQYYLNKMTGDAADLKPLVMSCLNDSLKKRPPVTQVSMTIKMVKDVCSEKSGRDGMSPIEWWAEVCNKQQSQVSSDGSNQGHILYRSGHLTQVMCLLATYIFNLLEHVAIRGCYI